MMVASVDHVRSRRTSVRSSLICSPLTPLSNPAASRRAFSFLSASFTGLGSPHFQGWEGWRAGDLVGFNQLIAPGIELLEGDLSVQVLV